MAGEGQKLRDARQLKGWSLAEAEEITKIRIRYLQALEEERYDIIPGIAYVKGFLRTYANHLGLNPEEILADYKASVQPEPEPSIEPPLKPIRSRSLWLRPAAVVVMAVIAIVAVIGIATALNSAESKAPDYDVTQFPSPPEEITPDALKPSEPTTSTPDSPTNQSPTPVIEGLVAKATFSADCWMSMRLDGGPVESMTYKGGTTKEFKANTIIEFLSIGNAGGIKINLNGTDLPPVGKAGQVVNNYVLTKETLTTLTQ